jgi:hypothetical protein
MSEIGPFNPPFSLLELVTAFRQRTDDLPGDVVDAGDGWQNDDAGLLWTNEEIAGFANEAVVELARRKPIRDSATSAVARIAVTADQATYPYSDKILSIRRAKLGDRVLTKTTHPRIDSRLMGWVAADTESLLYIEDTDERTLTIWGTPTEDATLELIVDRLPLEPMRWARRNSDTAEVRDEYHYALIDFMCHRGYLMNDSETKDKKKSLDFLELFTSNIGSRPSAHMEQLRRRERGLSRRTMPRFM